MSGLIYPIAMLLTMPVTLVIAGMLVRGAFAVTNPDIPRCVAWMFPLRGKWLYRGLATLAVILALPFIYLLALTFSLAAVCVVLAPIELIFSLGGCP